MSNLILVRHGQSEWNLQNKFTGWVDVDLTPKGKLEACKSGELIKDLNLDINYFYMGNEVAKTGTGKVATILFNTKQSFNESILEITDNSELVDQDDVEVQILTFGSATVSSN